MEICTTMVVDKDDFSEKMGYLTRAVEDNTKQMKALRAYVEAHMETEEKVMGRVYKWLAVLTLSIIVFHFADVEWTTVFQHYLGKKI